MIYGDNPQKINEREDKLGLKTYSYAPQIAAVIQSGNLYVYSINNPVQYIDPSGNIVLIDDLVVAGLVILAATAATYATAPLLSKMLQEMGKTFTDVYNMTAKEIQWLIELAKSKYAESQTASKSATAVAAPAAPDPNDDKDQNSYYKKGLKNIPDNWIEAESEKYKVKSDSFKNFLKSQGYDPKGWIKVVEKWAAPDGTIYQRHYWTNGVEYFYHGNGIEVFIPH